MCFWASSEIVHSFLRLPGWRRWFITRQKYICHKLWIEDITPRWASDGLWTCQDGFVDFLIVFFWGVFANVSFQLCDVFFSRISPLSRSGDTKEDREFIWRLYGTAYRSWYLDHEKIGELVQLEVRSSTFWLCQIAIENGLFIVSFPCVPNKKMVMLNSYVKFAEGT